MSSSERPCLPLQLAFLVLVPGVIVLASACASTSTIECESGVRCPPGLVCVEGYDTCGPANKVAACHGKAQDAPCTYEGLPGACVQGVCEPQPCERASDCDDGNPCTDDVCNQGQCESRFTTAPCDDGIFCNGPDRCEDGQCVSTGQEMCTGSTVCDETLMACVGCLSNADCPGSFVTDWSACQGSADNVCDISGLRSHLVIDWECEEQVCQEKVTTEAESCPLDTDGNSCDDGNACTEADTCAGGICQGQARDCDDGNPCTRDTCDEGGQCTYENEDYGTLCPAGNCDGQGSCVTCPTAGNPCTTGNPCELGLEACPVSGDWECMPVGPAPATVLCRPSTGTCDGPESCDGVSTTCPGDEPLPDETSCPGGKCMGGMCVP